MMTPSEMDPIWGATGCRKRETTDVTKTALTSQRFSDITISVNRWLSVEGRRCLILASTESTCDSRTPSWERSSKRCTVTMSSPAAGLRFRSGSETSWWPMRASSSKSRSRARHYVTSPAVPRTGNDGVSQGPSVGPPEGGANEPKPRNRADAAQISSASTKAVIFSQALLKADTSGPAFVAATPGSAHAAALLRGSSTLRSVSLREPELRSADPLSNASSPCLEFHPFFPSPPRPLPQRARIRQTVTHVPGLFRYRCRRPHHAEEGNFLFGLPDR